MQKEKPAQIVYDSRSADKFVVRLPNGMRDKIGDLALERTCSMNSIIVGQLAKLFDNNENIGNPFNIGSETFIRLYEGDDCEIVNCLVDIDNRAVVTLYYVSDVHPPHTVYKKLSFAEYARLIV